MSQKFFFATPQARECHFFDKTHQTAAPALFLTNFASRGRQGPFYRKTTLSRLRCCQFFIFATPQARECHFFDKTHQTAARSSVLCPKKPTSSLQSGALFRKNGTRTLGVLQKKKFCDTLSARMPFLRQNDSGGCLGPIFAPY